MDERAVLKETQRTDCDRRQLLRLLQRLGQHTAVANARACRQNSSLRWPG